MGRQAIPTSTAQRKRYIDEIAEARLRNTIAMHKQETSETRRHYPK